MSEDSAQILKDLIAGAIPVNPATVSHFVTREEFTSTVGHLETKIENTALKTKLWILTSFLAILVSGIGGYISLVNKLDRLSEMMPLITATLEDRRSWILYKDRQDDIQNRELEKLNPNYKPTPYEAPPK